jgi:hypothetical protein
MSIVRAVGAFVPSLLSFRPNERKQAMKRTITFFVGLSLSVAAFAVSGAETGPVGEVFVCKFKPGKTMVDFDAATAAFNKAADGLDAYKGYFAATLVPFRTDTPYDVVWIGSLPTLNAFARGADASMSKPMQASQAGFDAVMTCQSGLYFTSLLHDALPNEKGDVDTVVEAYSCKLNEGKTMADLDEPHRLYKEAVKAIAKADPKAAQFLMVEWDRWLANDPDEITYFQVNDDMESFARSETAYYTSNEGKAAEAAWGKVVNCHNNGLWLGHRVRAAAAQ